MAQSIWVAIIWIYRCMQIRTRGGRGVIRVDICTWATFSNSARHTQCGTPIKVISMLGDSNRITVS